MKIGILIRTWRESQSPRLGLRTLAREIGINHGTLARIERGEDVDGATMIRLLLWLFR